MSVPPEGQIIWWLFTFIGAYFLDCGINIGIVYFFKFRCSDFKIWFDLGKTMTCLGFGKDHVLYEMLKFKGALVQLLCCRQKPFLNYL